MAPKRKTRRANRPSSKIQHHHLLLRMEIQHKPKKEDKEKLEELVKRIIQDIHMKRLAEPQVYIVEYPRDNEGMSVIAPIQTSHIALHFWTRPDQAILHTKHSKCLLELDIYTCGSLTLKNVASVLHHLTQFKPLYVDITILNRNIGLTIERHMHWNSEKTEMTWPKWLDTPVFH